MRAGGAGADIAIEIEVEGAVDFQPIALHVDHVNLVIAFDHHDATGARSSTRK